MELYQRYGPALRRKCARMLGDMDEAEDVVQGLFVDIIQRGRADVELGYLYRAATTRCLNRMRNRKRRRELLDQHGEAVLGGSSRATAEGQVISRELLAHIDRRLDRRSAEIIVYHYVDGMSQGEIAELLGVSRRAVVKRLTNARRLIGPLSEVP